MKVAASKAEAGLEAQMRALCQGARAASAELARAKPGQRTEALKHAGAALRRQGKAILAANRRDLAGAKEAKLSPALTDRLMLDQDRVEAMAKGLEDVSRSARPGRHGAGRMETPERPVDFSRARAARRHRHRL